MKITKFLIFLTTILATKLIMKNHIFLFSHQDDEIAIFKTIKDSINTNKNVLIIYLTNGNISKSDNINFILKRENESKRVLEKLGVSLPSPGAWKSKTGKPATLAFDGAPIS